MAEAYNHPLICNFQSLTCYKCGIAFAVDAQVKQRWHESGSSFFCPNGHSQCYRESDVQKLRKQLDEANRTKEFYKTNAASEREAREKTQRQLRATKGAKTRLSNRIKNGVCPCCNRTFMNLQRHMTTQHPHFDPKAEPKANADNGRAP